jgi:hypothetical protein
MQSAAALEFLMCLSLGHKLHNFPKFELFLEGEQNRRPWRALSRVRLTGVRAAGTRRRSTASVMNTYRQGS